MQTNSNAAGPQTKNYDELVNSPHAPFNQPLQGVLFGQRLSFGIRGQNYTTYVSTRLVNPTLVQFEIGLDGIPHILNIGKKVGKK